MKKVLLAVIVLTIALTCLWSTAAFAEERTNADYKDTFAYTFLKEFCEKYPTRKAGLNVNEPAADSVQAFLKDKLVEVSDGKVTTSYKPFVMGEYVRGYNIEARLNKQGSDKQIIIGAHYDSVDGEGATDNASGVTALLLAARSLSQNVDKLPCSVVFVLFDGEEDGLFGSSEYVSNMTQSEKDSTLVMFNIDSVGNGDNLYVWCENKHTGLANLILTKSDKIVEKPYAKGTYNIDSGYGFGYVETPQSSDQTPFRVQGIPTALFFSGTYSADVWNYSESENPLKQVMNTSNDTFANLDANNQAEFVNKIEATATAISQTVLDSNFMQIAANQRKQLVNLALLGRTLWARIIGGALVIIVVILALVYYRKLQKRAILGTAEIKSNKVFTTPDANDIFTFDSNKPKDTKPDAEDIFTFKNGK